MLAWLAACAPRPTGIAPVTAGDREARYLAGLLQRERRAVMLQGTATIWPRAFAPCDSCPLRRLPAFQAGFALAAPDAFRLRVHSAFGTALDLGLAGDSLMAYAPAQRWGVALDAARDSLGVSHPGALAARLVGAGWRPPGPAWARGTWSGALLVLRWSEGEDSVAVAVDEAGVPAWARVWRGERRGVLVQYGRWEPGEGVTWPALLRVRDLGGAFEFTWSLEHMGSGGAGDRSRLAVRIPDDAERLGLEQLRGLLERMGSRP